MNEEPEAKPDPADLPGGTPDTTSNVPSTAKADEIQTPRELDPRLLRLLACPVTKRPLQYDSESQELISQSARLAFPIRDGVPLLTLDAARHLDDEPAAKNRG